MSAESRFTLSQRLRYRFDTIFARGAGPVLLLLVALLIFVFVIAALVQTAFSWGPDDQPVGFGEGFWQAFVRSLDPGTFGADEGNHFRVIGLIITLLGVLAMAVVIGLVSSAIDTRLNALRQGRSLVVEQNHTLILGHSSKAATIVAEIVEANASRRDAAIVVLTPEPPEEADRLIRRTVGDLRTSRLIVRTGDLTSIPDLETVNPAEARSVILLASEDAAADSFTVKSVLALLLLTRDNPRNIVCEVRDSAVADALRESVGAAVHVISSSEVVGRVAAQVARSSGLSAVYQELLDFSGDEIYMTNPGPLAGRNFGAALLGYERSTVIGIHSAAGEATLNPAMNRVIQSDDRLIVISEDDSLIGVPRTDVSWDEQWSTRALPLSPQERTLIVGWSHFVATIAAEIDGHVSPGSSLDLVVDPSLVRDVVPEAFPLQHQTVRVLHRDSLDMAALRSVVADGEYDHVLVLCYRDVLSPQDADARALLSLLAVGQGLDGRSANVVTELMQPEDVELASIAKPDDFVVSDRLLSLAMAQISENEALAGVFRDLLDTASTAVRLRPWTDYGLQPDASFAAVVAAARKHGETAIGWTCKQMQGHERDLGDGTFINPPKPMRASFMNGDRVVVLA